MACNDLNSHGSPPLTFAEANVNRSPNQGGGGSRGAPQQPSATIMKKIEDKILLRKTTLPEM